MLVDAWRTIPFMFLVLYAGLEVQPAELFEAAAVDGASRWQAFRHITVPLLTYIMLVAVLIRGMDAFREFDIIFVLTGAAPATRPRRSRCSTTGCSASGTWGWPTRSAW